MLKQLLTPFKLGVGGPLAGGRQYVSWVHIDDEVGILLWALDNPEVSGVVNSTAPIRRPTGSSRRRSAGPWDARRCCRVPGGSSST